MRGEFIEYQKLNSEDQKAFPALRPTIAEAQADVPDAANLYPGRYAAVYSRTNFRLRVRHRFLGRGIDVY